MFTPPPSPLPPVDKEVPPQEPEVYGAEKRSVGRRIKWTVLLVPLALVLITASTRYITHPAAFDVLSEGFQLNWETLTTTGVDWQPHKRHPNNDHSTNIATISGSLTASGLVVPSTQSATATASTTAATAQAVPTIPTNPDLPAPFPQAFDSDITQNYSSMTCFNFFSNMTNTAAFRSCRPFSMLLQTSNAFVATQDNLTELNAVVWGTCNPPLGYDQCASNIAWFADAIQTACAVDIADNSVLVSSTLTALKAYSVMHDAACQADPTTNTYCYVNAVHNSNPSDQYFYQLPLDISVPNTSTPVCSSCTKSIMNIFAEAYPHLEALQSTYPSAQSLADTACGEGYAPTVAASTDGAMSIRIRTLLLALVASLTVWTLY
ncbi:hypothetical protein BDZ89DRAFT_992754 [Hymenopellis radicata]|nr:hypothetical protein BDZ89DRAFT_992754 [Hymenopellis radicata]